MSLAQNKTKLVCTIGPASESLETLQKMLHAGMNIARLNFSHGEFSWHKTAIDNLHHAAVTAGKPVTIIADLPGPKMRIGQIAEEPIELKQGDAFTFTTNAIIGDRQRAFVNFPRLTEVVKSGDILFLNDGIIHLEVVSVEGADVRCRVLIGGELLSRKGEICGVRFNLRNLNLRGQVQLINIHRQFAKIIYNYGMESKIRCYTGRK